MKKHVNYEEYTKAPVSPRALPNGAFSDMSIQQIAEQLGYSTTGSFSRAFKKIEKVTPTFCR